ncbi:MAG: ankyrin repeat domain-containing protein [Candidatus Berkiella sp.]
MILFELIYSHNHDAISTQLQDENYIPTLDEKERAIGIAVDANDAAILQLLLNDEQKRFDPTTNNHQVLINAVLFQSNDILELLLADNRVDAGAQENTAIRLAAGLGNVKAVLLLLAKARVNPSANDNAAIYCALDKGYCDVIRLLLPHSMKAGIPFTTFIDSQLSDADLLFYVEEFLADFNGYLSNYSLLTDAQCAAIELLLRQEEMHELEVAQIAALGDNPESAMNDSKVIKSRELFTHVQTHFNQQFNAFGNTDHGRLKAIEKSIRGMILEAITAENIDDEQKAFIALHKEALVSASDDTIMKLAREKYFNTKAPHHAAWRGYDAKAPYQGEFKNLLTTQSSHDPIFSTHASHQGAITAVMASDEIRKMMAYYYLLVTDQNEPELLALRKANFISELADLRLAHQNEYEGEDAPSCYPGYLGRMLNLAYGHSLSKHIMTPKSLITEYLSPIILEEFKRALQQCHSAEQCEQLLQALSWLTLAQAKSITLGINDYPDEIYTLREKFVSLLMKTREFYYQEINKLLKEKGLAPLDDIGRKFVKLCLLDPAHQFNFGRLGAVYSRYMQDTYPPSSVKLIPNAKKKSLNPFKAQHVAASKMGKASSTQLDTLKRKSRLFKKLKQEIEAKAKQELPHNENAFDPKGMVLLLKTAITEMPNDNLETTALFNEAFAGTLRENAHSDEAYPQALHILQLFKNRTEKDKTPGTPKKLPMAESPMKQDTVKSPVKSSAARVLFKD